MGFSCIIHSDYPNEWHKQWYGYDSNDRNDIDASLPVSLTEFSDAARYHFPPISSIFNSRMLRCINSNKRNLGWPKRRSSHILIIGK
jgi:hypothetical protein